MVKFTWFNVCVCVALGFSGCHQTNHAPESAATPMNSLQWQDLVTPGEEHKILQSFVGDWQHTARFWHDPFSEPQVSHGTNTNSWILDGRFLRQEVKGSAFGKPFEGLGITGFDKVRGEYSSLWIDNTSTGFMSASAHYIPATRTFFEQGTMSDPVTGEKNRPFSAKWKIKDDNNYAYEMFLPGPGGKNYKAMEINYSRVR